VLGICNGAQVLVEAGLVPGGGTIELALARNRMEGRSGYYARWVYVRVEPSPCVFTRDLDPGTLLPLPVAHGEGRFTGTVGTMVALSEAGQTPLRYATESGALASGFPSNPNGAEQGAAAVCNRNGNVLAIMPHPERAQDVAGLWRGAVGVWAEARRRKSAGYDVDDGGPGLTLFRGLARHLEEAP
jgi:phosphoribosylformylglycinamidine synthase